MGLADAMSVLAESRPYMFSKETKSGGGSQGNSRDSSTVGKIDGTKAEQEAYIRNKFKK